MRTFVCFMIVLVSSSNLWSQDIIRLNQLSKKEKKIYQKAVKCYDFGKVAEAKTKLQELHDKKPNFKNGIEKLITWHWKDKEFDKVIHFLGVLYELEPNDPILSFNLAQAHLDAGNYEEALLYIKAVEDNSRTSEKLKAKAQAKNKQLNFIIEAITNPVPYNPQRLTDSINTEAIEYHPQLSADGSTLAFVRVQKGKNGNEDLYLSKKDSSGNFVAALELNNLNTERQEGAFTLAGDGNTIIFTGCNYRDSFGGCDLYISFKKGDHWTKPRNMGPGINSRYWDSSPTLSSDNKTLYFASKRPGGKGGSDIWMTEVKNRKWTSPTNLGNLINTAANDEAPFIHPDNETLYFISEGHLGMGSYDIFLSKYIDSLWTKPKNLGYPINTPGREGGIYVDLEGSKAYYSSQIDFNSARGDSIINGDIYSFELEQSLKPVPTSYLKLIVKEATTNLPLNTTIEVIDLINTDNIKTITTSKDGQGFSTISSGMYALNVNKEGYIFYSANIDFPAGKTLQDPFIYEVYLRPIDTKEKTKPTILNNIFFKLGSAELEASSSIEISKLFQLLVDRPEIKIKILGHTDNIGQEEDNLQLSQDRAKAVKQALIQLGAQSSKILTEGLGESQPIADNETESGRRLNRRTEFIVIK